MIALEVRVLASVPVDIFVVFVPVLLNPFLRGFGQWSEPIFKIT